MPTFKSLLGNVGGSTVLTTIEKNAPTYIQTRRTLRGTVKQSVLLLLLLVTVPIEAATAQANRIEAVCENLGPNIACTPSVSIELKNAIETILVFVYRQIVTTNNQRGDPGRREAAPWSEIKMAFYNDDYCKSVMHSERNRSTLARGWDGEVSTEVAAQAYMQINMRTISGRSIQIGSEGKPGRLTVSVPLPRTPGDDTSGVRYFALNMKNDVLNQNASLLDFVAVGGGGPISVLDMTDQIRFEISDDERAKVIDALKVVVRICGSFG